MTSAPSLRVEFLPIDQLAARSLEGWGDVLGVTAFATAGSSFSTAIPTARLALDPLSPPGAGGSLEVWRAPGTLRSGTHGRVRWRATDGLLFGVVSLPESGSSEAGDNAALREAVLGAYADMFGCLRSFGMPRPLRIWNYLADINRIVDGVERYQVFNEARQQAFRSAEQGVRLEVPAASALGAPAGHPFTVYFLACAADSGIAIENPRQVAAYDYPPEYGAFSPSFSRATLANGATGRMLFISGTASILGYRSVHAADVVAQTRETLANIAAVVAEANRVAGEVLFAPDQLLYKVYLRRPEDQSAVAAALHATVQPARPVLYLHADICRKDLLVEIEAVGQAATTSP